MLRFRWMVRTHEIKQIIFERSDARSDCRGGLSYLEDGGGRRFDRSLASGGRTLACRAACRKWNKPARAGEEDENRLAKAKVTSGAGSRRCALCGRAVRPFRSQRRRPCAGGSKDFFNERLNNSNRANRRPTQLQPERRTKPT